MPHPADRRAAERRLFRPGPSGPLSVCLVYPNTYAVGMANLGFQALLRILAEDPRVTADRPFLRGGPRAEWPRTLRSVEQDRPLGDFDVVALSLSFEADYVHVLDCLALAGIPLWRRERDADAPLVLAGGPATFLNPEPLAEFVDLFLIGEAEEMLGEFLARATAGPPSREGILERSEAVRGAYRPDRYSPEYDAAGDLLAFPYRGPGGGRVERRLVADLGGVDTNSAAPALARALGAGGNRSVTVAPEAGSERMRRVINKNLSEAEILRAAEWLVGGGVDALKLYVMVGLPTETAEDVEAIVDLTARVRARLAGSGRPRVGRILVSINPFGPQPWTPFQWEPMEAIPSLRRKLAPLRRALGAIPAVELETARPREAYL